MACECQQAETTSAFSAGRRAKWRSACTGVRTGVPIFQVPFACWFGEEGGWTASERAGARRALWRRSFQICCGQRTVHQVLYIMCLFPTGAKVPFLCFFLFVASFLLIWFACLTHVDL